MKKILLILFLFTQGLQAQEAGDWEVLFNGKDLTGWVPKFTFSDLGVNYRNTFRVEDGLLTVSYDQWKDFHGEFGHLFYNRSFSYYILELEYRFRGDQVPGGPGWAFRNSGTMLHGQDPKTMTRDQDFPISIEGQLLGGDGTHERPTQNVCTPGTNIYFGDDLIKRHCTNSTSATYHGDQWVKATYIVLGDSLIEHQANGETVMSYHHPTIDGSGIDPALANLFKDGMAVDHGFFSLQAESHPVQFRNIRILNLVGCKDPTAKNYKSYYVKNAPELCTY